MRLMEIRRTGLAIAVGGLALTVAATAQPVLEEVVVTAQKREQSLQDVPISVQTVAGVALEEQHLVEMEALSAQLPNIHVSESALGDKLFIRGIGSGINAGFEQSVGTFIDGVYYGRSLQTRSQFLDIERIEVLRGPQSTFFGNNAIAGALNLTTRRPGEVFSGYLNSFHETQNDEYHIEGAAGGALTETVALRVAGLMSGLDGWVRNLNTGQTEGDEKNRAARVSLGWTPTASFDALLKLETGRFDVLGRGLQVTNCPPPVTESAGTCAMLTQPVFSAFGPEYAAPLYNNFDDTFDLYTQYNGPVHPRFTQLVDSLGAAEAGRAIAPPLPEMSARDIGELANHNATLTLNWQLHRHQLTAVSSYSEYTFEFRQTSDFQPLPNAAVHQSEAFAQFTQEVRLASTEGINFDYMLGAYYQAGELDIAETINLYMPPPYAQPAASYFSDPCRAPARASDPGCRLPATLASMTSMHGQRDNSGAAFAVLSWHLTDKLSATLGARYTFVDKDMERSQRIVDRAPGVTVACPAALAAMLPCIQGAPLLLTAPSPPRGRAFGWSVGDLDLGRRDSDLTPSFTLQWNARPDLMLYGSYGEGFKAGGFDHRNLALDPLGGQFGPESVDAFELGMKSTVRDGVMQLNLALFRSDYRDLQVSTFDGVVNFLVNNAATARSQGVEADMRWLINDRLVFNAAFAFLDAKWQDYRNAQCRAVDMAMAPTALCKLSAESGLLEQDLSGAAMLMAPRWSGNAGAQYQYPLRGGLMLNAQFLLSWQASQFLAADNDPATLQPGFAKLNLRVALASTTGWELALVGRNVTDRLTSSHAEDMPLRSTNSFFRMTERPRTLALQMQYRW